jgi:hypothetical protein
MSIERLHPDSMIDALVADLGAVQPRRAWHEAMVIGGLIAIELLLFVMLRDLRPNLPAMLTTPIFWWKSGSFGMIAVIAAAALLVSLDPATTHQPRLAGLWRGLAVLAPTALALGWLIDAGASGGAALLARLDWREGLDCLLSVWLLSLPLVLVFALLMRRGASTQPARSAAAAGLAAAGFGAFVFAFHCPHDDPLYVTVWYGGAVLAVAGVARLLLPRLTRW